MSRAKEWWQKWGVWFGPTAFVALFTVATRVDAHFYNKTMLEARVRAVEFYIEEHRKVTDARIAQIDAIERLQAIDHERFNQFSADVRSDIEEIKRDVREIRARLPNGRLPGQK